MIKKENLQFWFIFDLFSSFSITKTIILILILLNLTNVDLSKIVLCEFIYKCVKIVLKRYERNHT